MAGREIESLEAWYPSGRRSVERAWLVYHGRRGGMWSESRRVVGGRPGNPELSVPVRLARPSEA